MKNAWMPAFTRWLAPLALVAALACGSAAQNIPPMPQDSKFVQDYARLLDAATMNAIGEVQRTAFEQHDTPIVVVTVRSMADYGARGMTIENFASRWFNQWQIGKKMPDGTLSNKGMLLLVSPGDRRARIELGADWGRSFDAHAQRIMNDAIVPRFRGGDFRAGILAGVQELGKMAAIGPGGAAASAVAPSPMPDPSAMPGSPLNNDAMGDSPGTVAGKVQQLSPLPRNIVWLLGLGGIVLVIAGVMFPQYRKQLVIAGAAMILGAVFFWVLLFVFAMIANKRSGRGGGGRRIWRRIFGRRVRRRRFLRRRRRLGQLVRREVS